MPKCLPSEQVTRAAEDSMLERGKSQRWNVKGQAHEKNQNFSVGRLPNVVGRMPGGCPDSHRTVLN